MDGSLNIVIIEISVAIISLLLAILVYNYNKNKDLKIEAEQKGSIITEIRNLKESVESSHRSLLERIIVIEDRAELRAQGCKEHGERLVAVEKDARAAHRRLDEHVTLFADIRKTLAELSKEINN